MICDYRSTVYKENSNVKEAVLQMMYAYRKERFPKAMVFITEGLMSAIVNKNKNLAILKYLLTMDPPAYSCRRFWDWIEPHVINQIQHLSDNAYNASNREDLEMYLKTHQHIEQIK